MDLRAIAEKHWTLFKEVLGEGGGGKDKQTHWIQEVNDVRKIASHASKGAAVTFEQLARLKQLDEWLSSVAQEVVWPSQAALDDTSRQGSVTDTSMSAHSE